MKLLRKKRKKKTNKTKLMDCSENEDAEHKEWFEGIMKMRKEMEEGKT